MILVTGGTGFVGRHLVNALVRNGKSVRVLVRDPSRSTLLPRETTVIHGDLGDPHVVAAAVAGARAVVHLAAQMDGSVADEGTMIAANVRATSELVAAAADAGVGHVVYVSSAGVYGSRRTFEPASEADDPRPGTAYERSKLAADEAVRAGAAPWTVLRPSGVFGPGRDHTAAFLRSVATRRVWFYGGTDTLLNPVYVDDVVAAIVFSLEQPTARGEIINVGGPRILSHRELVDVAAAALGRSAHQVRVPRLVTRAGAGAFRLACAIARREVPQHVEEMSWRVVNRAVNTDKARRLGMTSTSLEAAMASTVHQLRAQSGHLPIQTS